MMRREQAETLVDELLNAQSTEAIEAALRKHDTELGPFFYEMLESRATREFSARIARLHVRLHGRTGLLDIIAQLMSDQSEDTSSRRPTEDTNLERNILDQLLDVAQSAIAWRDEPPLALRALRAAGSIVATGRHPDLHAMFHLQRGNYDLRFGNTDEADRSFETGLGCLADHPSQDVAGALIVSRGMLLLQQRRFVEAIQHYEANLPALTLSNQRLAAELNLAWCHASLGRISTAYALLVRLEGDCREAGEPSILADIQGTLGVVCERLGLDALQERYLLASHKARLRPVDVSRPLDWNAVAVSCMNVHLFYAGRRERAKAREWLDQCAKLFKSGGTDPRNHILLRLEIAFALDGGEKLGAWRLGRDVIPGFMQRSSSEIDDEELLTAATAGRAALAIGQAGVAGDVFGRLVDLYEQAEADDLLVSALGYRACALMALGRPQAALAEIDRMIVRERNLRTSIDDPLHQFSFSAMHEAMHDTLISTLERVGETRRVFEVIQIAKAHAIGFRAGRRITFEELSMALPARSAFLEYDSHDGRGRCIVIMAGSVEPLLVKLDVTSDIVEGWATQLSRLLAWARLAPDDNPFDCFAAMAAELLAPVLRRLDAGIEQLIIAPAGSASSLPFHAFPTAKSRRLIDDFAVSYAPSATVWMAAAARSHRPRNATVVAHASSLDSPGVRANFHNEADRVARVLDEAGCMVDPMCDQDQTHNAVLRGLDRDILHVSAHGSFSDNDPGKTGLLLSNTVGDIIFPLDALARTDSNSELVFLSGCDTGRVSALRNQEILGLMSVLLGNNTTCTLLSFWPIPATSSVIPAMVEEFYRGWLIRGLSKAGALRQCMLLYRDEPVHVWAGFGVFGFGAEPAVGIAHTPSPTAGA